MAKRIVIIVSGGCVQEIYADNKDDVSVEVIDYDNLCDGEGWTASRAEKYMEKQTEYLAPIDKF